MKLSLPIVLLSASLLSAQTPAPTPPAPKHEANFETERKQADELYLAGKILDSLPLYEDLCRQDQTIAVFAERHGSGLLKKSITLTDPAAQKAMNDQGLAEIRRAQKLGDNSAYVQGILSLSAKSTIGSAVTGLPLSIGYTYPGTPEAQAVMKDAEAAFGHEDVPGALKLYLKAAALDPRWYSAALFAGDMYFREGDQTNAGLWFQKAILIDPDRDTAYRYWGDALFKTGDRDAAKARYEQAIVAEPYAKPAWLALQQWAKLTSTPLAVPQVAIPKYTTNPDGSLQADPALATDAAHMSGRTAWVVYETCRVKHAGPPPYNFGFSVGKDGSTQPTGHYHSLADETDCLKAALADVRLKLVDGSLTPQALDRSLKNLDALEKAGMLSCWILLSNADMQLRFDYPAYRKDHRDQLVEYVDRYVVQPKAAPVQ